LYVAADGLEKLSYGANMALVKGGVAGKAGCAAATSREEEQFVDT
jgi:hypothetical protein